MQKILIYGDSNLWGFNNNKRIEDKKQWANMLACHLKDKYTIIQEGLPGRIAGNYKKEEIQKNGLDTFQAIFESSAPVDYVIIALGTNDFQFKYRRKAKDIYNDLLTYKKIVDDLYNNPKYYERFFNQKMPDFIYILPSQFDYLKDASNILDEKSEQERLTLIEMFKNSNYKYVELNNIDLVKGDGIHYSIKGQKMVFDEIKKLF